MLESLLANIAEENKRGPLSPQEKKERISFLMEDVFLPALNRIRNCVTYTDILDRIRRIKHDTIETNVLAILEKFHKEDEKEDETINPLPILQKWREVSVSYFEEVRKTRRFKQPKQIRQTRQTKRNTHTKPKA